MPINRQTGLTERWYDPTTLIEKMKDPDVVTCTCGCSYLEQVPVYQFPKNHSVILGQAVPPHADMGFYILRCIKCGEIYEPQVQIAARDSARRAYDAFLDEMERPGPGKSDKGEVL